jgi:RNA polymerase primary sigma factor
MVTSVVERRVAARSVRVKTPTRPAVSRADQSALQRETEELLSTEIRFVYTSDFDKLDGSLAPIREAEVLLDDLRLACSDSADLVSEFAESGGVPNWSTADPLLTFEQEQTLFRAMNLLRYRANCLRCRLSPKAPSARAIAEIRQMLEISERIRAQLVRSNLRLVSSISRKFSASHHDVDDFSSDGSMILLGAIDRFDYSRKFRFSTYATHSIQRHFFRAWKVRQRRKQRFPCTSAEILAEVAESSADAPICEDPQSVVAQLLNVAAEVLDDREYQILMHRFGLNGDGAEGRTLREIAVDLGVSKERVRQLQIKALEKLRPFLNPALFNLEFVEAE